MYLHYDDEPAPGSATAEIWRTCLRRAAALTAFYAVLAALVLAVGAAGLLDYRLTVR